MLVLTPFVAGHWGQAPLGLSLCLVLFPPCGHRLLAFHPSEPRARLFGLPCKQRRIVVVGLADDVAQEVRVRFWCAGLRSTACELGLMQRHGR
jgi:hypothetical protein